MNSFFSKKEKRKMIHLTIMVMTLGMIAIFTTGFITKQQVFHQRVNDMINFTVVKEYKDKSKPNDFVLKLEFHIPKNSELKTFYPNKEHVTIEFESEKKEWVNYYHYYSVWDGLSLKEQEISFENIIKDTNAINPKKESGTLLYHFKSEKELKRFKKEVLSAKSWKSFYKLHESGKYSIKF